MNFAPYSPSPDEDRTSRTPKKSKQQYHQPAYSSYQSGSSSAAAAAATADSYAEQGLLGDHGASSSSSSSNPQTVRVNKYETTLPIRVDMEASLAYVLGPVTGLLLLILERQNDYVRFHAWQSSLVFSFLMFAQFILLFISSFLSWVLFFFNIFLLIWLVYRAYLDGASLERYEVPYFGMMASEYVDTE